MHRASLAEVFLTSCQKIGENRFSLTGQWPRAHTFFTSPDGRRHDPLQAAETMRQVGLYLAHSEFNVPLGHHFVMWDLSFTTDHDRLLIGDHPSDLTLTAVCTDPVWKGKRLSDFGMDITIWRDGESVAHGGGRFTCVSEATYRRLRGGREPVATPDRVPTQGRRGTVRGDQDTGDPAEFGRTRSVDVVLRSTDKPGRWLLSPDPDHPILFDHGGDHVPGMVLMEAARQAARALLAPGYTLAPTSMSTDFCRYAEFDSPCWIEAHLLTVQQAGKLTVHVTGHQDGEHVFLAQLQGPVTAAAA
ncbi:ScbA/BarX family gamma-butyrolactone biosynthesis protein [Streptomyces sp. CA-250714]|uniref:ScbA/BarX family gamma-butyrolactone biosynthesis protein n=1 Tax=Streptomyces sp. CA-250714 TaxID=3240060 RepID=UPI003D8A6BA8